MTPNDGGPAFPCPSGTSFGFDPHNGKTGLTIRDYFAAMALQGLCVGRSEIAHDFDEAITKQAKACYRLADAMLTQREKE